MCVYDGILHKFDGIRCKSHYLTGQRCIYYSQHTNLPRKYRYIGWENAVEIARGKRKNRIFIHSRLSLVFFLADRRCFNMWYVWSGGCFYSGTFRHILSIFANTAKVRHTFILSLYAICKFLERERKNGQRIIKGFSFFGGAMRENST